MSISITSPVTGAAQTGLISPTYTVVDDNAPPGSPGKQKAVTALGGTQAGVTVHTVSSPFTVNFTRPSVLKMLGQPNPVTGLISNVPMNDYTVIVRKGVTPAVNQPAKAMIVKITVSVPAGAETYDTANVRAALSLAIGSWYQQSAGHGDTLVNGIL